MGEFERSEPEDALRAIAAADQALAGWSDTPAPVRAGVLFRALEIMRQRGDDIARTITIEEGKPLPDAQGEVKRAMNIILKSSGVGHREQGTEAVDFFSEVITVYIDHAAAPRQQARFI